MEVVIGVILAGDLAREVLGSEVELVALGARGRQLVGCLLEKLQGVRLVDSLALGCADTVLHPLPELTSGNLSCSSILHEVVDGNAADSSDPGLHVAEADVQVLLDALLGDGTGDVHVEQIVLADGDVFSSHEKLVGRGHVLVEDLEGDAGESWMGNPGSVVSSTGFTELVSADTIHGFVVGFGVVLDGNLSCHAAHGVDTALVAGLDEELHVGLHEGDGHRDGGTVWEDKVGVVAELLDDAEDVVPSTTVEARAVVTELVDDLVHLKGSKDGLNQDRASDGTPRHSDVVLGKVEGIVPEASLKVALHLGEVEIRTKALALRLKSVVEEVETEIEEGAGDSLAVNSDVLLLQVPATGTDNKGRKLAVSAELVLFRALLEVNLTTVGVVEVDLTVDHVIPSRGAGRLTLEIGHVSIDIRVERVHNHLPVSGAGDLNTAVHQTRSRSGTFPCGVLADVLGLREEVRKNTAVKLSLASLATLKEDLTALVERAVQEGEKGEGLGGEDLAVDVVDFARDGHALEDGFDRSHCELY
ncbi:hypothetical protein HG530_002170 [Fusarium avenaceum]|nr:hypothetical protein HG530_002170 [Fusarium avenaceum]